MQKNQIGLLSHIIYKLKWIEDLNIRPETIKLLEENIGKNLSDMSLGNDFFSYTTKQKQQNKK